MDEEDLAHMNDDRQLENTETFRQDAFAGTREELGEKSLSGALESLIVPAKTSIGQTLLQKLGWRPGQGLGPRVTHRKLKIQDGKLGRARAGIEEDEEDMEQMYKHTYAPRDSRLLTYTAKDDKEGLGYTKGAGMGRLPARRPSELQSLARLLTRQCTELLWGTTKTMTHTGQVRVPQWTAINTSLTTWRKRMR